MVDLLLRWAPLDTVAEFGALTITVALAWVLSVKGGQGFWSGARGGGEKVSITLVSIEAMGSPECFGVGCSTPYFSVQKYGGGA